MIKITLIALFFAFTLNLNAQETEKKIIVTAWEGFAVAGYVDSGAFVNFGGPSIKLVHKPYAIIFGMLPSLKIKEDQVPEGAKKNSIVIPSLGFGLTYLYKHLAVQVPFYYNQKNATTDGKWNIGFGLGYKF
jgi:hypothetical protein